MRKIRLCVSHCLAWSKIAPEFGYLVLLVWFYLLWTALFSLLNMLSFFKISIKQSLTIGRWRKTTHNLERFGSSAIQWVIYCTNLWTLVPYLTYCIKNATISYMWVYRKDDETLYNDLERDLDFRPEKVLESVMIDVLRKPEMQQEESTLLLNLVLHFVRSINFTTYQKLIDDLILVLKAKGFLQGGRVSEYPAKIIWKSSTAVCEEKYAIHRLTRLRFFTSQVCLHFALIS